MMVPGSDRLGVTRGVNCSRLLAHRYVERYEDDVLAGGENLADWSRRGWRERAEKICYLSGRDCKTGPRGGARARGQRRTGSSEPLQKKE